jgi:hypothetical protein
MEKELEWESSNVAIKITLIKQQNQRSRCLLLTLKQEDQAILPNPRASFMVKSSRNNGGSGTNTCLCARDGREEDGTSFLYCDVITVGSCLEPIVIAQHHWQFLARIGSDKWTSSHCRCKPQTGSDVDLHCQFWSSPNYFLIFKLRTGNKGTSLLVHSNPAVMRLVVMFRSIVVICS